MSAADFIAMDRSDNGPLFIGDVIHKTVLKVNEKGTESADLIELCFDRPFVCGIVDMGSGAPLFLGTIETLS